MGRGRGRKGGSKGSYTGKGKSRITGGKFVNPGSRSKKGFGTGRGTVKKPAGTPSRPGGA